LNATPKYDLLTDEPLSHQRAHRPLLDFAQSLATERRQPIRRDAIPDPAASSRHGGGGPDPSATNPLQDASVPYASRKRPSATWETSCVLILRLLPDPNQGLAERTPSSLGVSPPLSILGRACMWPTWIRLAIPLELLRSRECRESSCLLRSRRGGIGFSYTCCCRSSSRSVSPLAQE